MAYDFFYNVAKPSNIFVNVDVDSEQFKNLKILPVGDSLTYGSGCLSGWRYQTYKNLYSAGITFEFVGPYSSPWDRRLGSRYNKHGGVGGWKIQDVIDKADEYNIFVRAK